MSAPLKVFRVTIMVVDHDRLGADGVKAELECVRFPNGCIHPRVARVEGVEIDDESYDGSPLNQSKAERWVPAFEALWEKSLTRRHVLELISQTEHEFRRAVAENRNTPSNLAAYTQALDLLRRKVAP